MSTLQEQIERLQETITRQEAQVRDLEGEVLEIRRELEGFEVRYNEVVKGIAERVRAVREAINDIETLRLQQRRGADDTAESLWRDAQANLPPHEPELPHEDYVFEVTKRPKVDDDLKRIYRRLARQYHPDLAQDDADRIHRTQLMAMINDAYAQQDRDALAALQNAAPNEESDLVKNDLPLAVLQLRQLQQTSAELAMRIEDLKLERFDLLHNPMMDLKIQTSLGRSKGRDVLRELAKELQEEYWSLMRRLDTLRDNVI
jgi:hypothetical protein